MPPVSVLWGYSSVTTGPALGESHTLTDALKRAEFWVLFLIMCVVYGAGLTLPNNLSSIVRALDEGYDAAPFTTFSSIFQSLGRLSGGMVSEYNLQVHGTSRVTSFGIWVAMFSLSTIVFSFTNSIGMLYATVPLSTFTFGGVSTIFAPLCSELFGLLNMGMIYSVLRVSVLAGSATFGRMFASVYEMFQSDSDTDSEGDFICKGNECFAATFFVAGVCGVATTAGVLFIRSRARKCYNEAHAVFNKVTASGDYALVLQQEK